MGLLVRMIWKIIVKILSFLLVGVMFITGFAIFFIALGAPAGESLFWVLNTGVFGQTPVRDSAMFDPLERGPITHTMLLFELLMFLVSLVSRSLLADLRGVTLVAFGRPARSHVSVVLSSDLQGDFRRSVAICRFF